MSMIECPECKNEISDRAAACPKCGCPIKENIFFNQKQYRDEQSIIDGENYEKGMHRSWLKRQLHLVWLIPLSSIIMWVLIYVMFFSGI